MTNIASILERRLGASRVELLRSAARAASELGVPLHLVGGSVRDALLGGLKHRCDTPHPSPLPQGEREQGATDLDVSFVVVPAEAGTQGRGHEDTPHPSPLPQGEREQGATDLDVSFVGVPAEAGTQGRGHEDTPHPSPLPQGERGQALSRKGRGGAHGAGT